MCQIRQESRMKGGKVASLAIRSVSFWISFFSFSFYYFEQCVFFQFQITKLTCLFDFVAICCRSGDETVKCLVKC